LWNEKLQFCGDELIGLDDWVVQWRRYALKETKSKNGKGFKKLTLIYKNIFSSEFIKHFNPKLQHFVKHNLLLDGRTSKLKHM
jgi:hypothetical protein